MERVDRQLGEYRLLARLAEGGQSTVYLAARSGPHGFFRPVVVKALPENFKGDSRLEALFYQEATISSRFSHPNVVTVHDAKRSDGEHFMVMDYVAGQTVADLAQRAFGGGEGIVLDETLVILLDACRGLDHVHSFRDVDARSYSIVHCDISPQNLMVTYSGSTRVFDFGISQIVGESEEDKSELAGGKYSYMSPEQVRREELDVRSDIFSLGIILYELAAGTRLFRYADQARVTEAITSESIDPPSTVAGHLGERFDEIAMRALQRDPEQRYQTAGAMADDIEELLDRRGAAPEAVRSQLGVKTESLFEEERREIASTLRSARRQLADEEGAGDEAVGETDRERQLEEQLEEAEQTIDQLRENAARATEVTSRLTDELDELRRRQDWLVRGICVLAAIALAIAGIAYMSQQGAFEGDREVAAEERVAE